MSKKTNAAGAGSPIITLQQQLASNVRDAIAKAHLSLHAVIQMLRVDGVNPDPACLAHLLEYIEGELIECDELLSPSLH